MALERERSSLNGVGRSVLDPGWTIERGRDGDRGCSATRRAGRRRNRHAYSSRQRPAAASEQGIDRQSEKAALSDDCNTTHQFFPASQSRRTKIPIENASCTARRKSGGVNATGTNAG